MSRRDWRWKWVTKKPTGSFTPGAIWRDAAGRHNDAPLEMTPAPILSRQLSRDIAPNPIDQIIRGGWYRPGNFLQQLLYCGDIAPNVNSWAIFDVPVLSWSFTSRMKSHTLSKILHTDPKPGSRLPCSVLFTGDHGVGTLNVTKVFFSAFTLRDKKHLYWKPYHLTRELSARINNYTYHKVCSEITYPAQNFSRGVAEVWWMNK